MISEGRQFVLVTCVITLCSLIGKNPLPQKPQIPLQMHLRGSQCTCDIHAVDQESSIFTVFQRMHHGKLSLKCCKKILLQQCHIKDNILESRKLFHYRFKDGKNKILTLTFLLHEAWFTFWRNVNSQKNRSWLYENSQAVHEVPVHGLKMHWVHTKSRGLCFKETNSNHYTKLLQVRGSLVLKHSAKNTFEYREHNYLT